MPVTCISSCVVYVFFVVFICIHGFTLNVIFESIFSSSRFSVYCFVYIWCVSGMFRIVDLSVIDVSSSIFVCSFSVVKWIQYSGCVAVVS